MAIQEFLFSIDDFQNPKIVEGPEAVATLLVRLLLLEPGTIQSHPDAGVGLMSRYRYSQEGIAEELKSDFKNQIETYLPQFSQTQITVTERDKQLQITAEIDGNLYGINYDSDTNEIKTNYASLNDL